MRWYLVECVYYYSNQPTCGQPPASWRIRGRGAGGRWQTKATSLAHTNKVQMKVITLARAHLLEGGTPRGKVGRLGKAGETRK